MVHRHLIERGHRWIGRYSTTLLFVLLVITIMVGLFAALGWLKARDAQQRVNTIELQRAQEAVGKKVADVATCFNRAKARPQLTIILRSLAAGVADATGRIAAIEFVEQYERDTPTVADCVILARKLGIDPKPYIENPPSEAGNQEGR